MKLTIGTRPVADDRRFGQLALAVIIVTVSSIVVALATGLIRAPSETPYSSSSPAAVTRVLAAATTGTDPANDPPVTLPSGVEVKSSNYDGVQVGDTTYYYNLAPGASYDPLARGDVSSGQIQVVAVVGDAPNRVMIYTVTNNDSPFSHIASTGTLRH